MKKDLKELSIKELNKQKSDLKTILIAFIVVLSLLCITLIYTYIKTNEFSALMIMPFALSPIVILNYNNYKRINQEIDSRK